MHRNVPALRRSLLTTALLATPLFAAADTGAGVDTWRASKLDPTAGAASATPDPRGTSWLSPGQRRSPGGMLYLCPAEPPDLTDAGDWAWYGNVQFGYLSTSGDDGNALWNRYVAWDSGLVLGLLQLSARRAADGSYADVRANRTSEDDAFFEAAFGRAGSYKVQAFLRELPNVLSHNAKPIWNGVGTNALTLPANLSPAGSTTEQVAAASAATPERTLKVTRSKQGVGFDMFLSPQWTVHANFSDEERNGARPFGGAFYYGFAFPDNAAVFETTKPIDDRTINLGAALRYAGPVWRMDFAYAGSFYRDRYTRYTYENPFALTPIVPGATSPPLVRGQFATEPDNGYHNLRATFTRKLPWNGEASLTASAGQMRQNDALIAPIDCTGTFGIDGDGSGVPGPNNPFLYSCAQWNTPAALSRPRADLAIDTTRVDARATLQPGERFTLRAGATFNRDDYRGTYLAYNPLTGDYGYITENGAAGSLVPGAVGTWNPLTSPSAIVRVRNLPLDRETTSANLGADFRASEHNTFGATASFKRDERTNRERERADTSSVKLTWINRALAGVTLRANATWLKRRGDDYVYDPYGFTYSTSLPGFVPPPDGVPSFTVDAMRKYDLADVDETKFDVMATLALAADMTLSATVRGDRNDYDAQIGRQRYDTLGATLQWEWQPSPATRASAYFGYDMSRLDLANVGDVNTTPDPTLGGANYPDSARWWSTDRQHNRNAGFTLDRSVGRWRFDAAWNALYARGITDFRFNSGSALAYFADSIGGIRDGAFPALKYRVDSVTVGATYAWSERWSVRVFDLVERGRIEDWHYFGFDAERAFGRRIYTDGGPEDYRANLIGVLVDVKL
ncbi:MtrB/PioB family outer membrane beta-barrel protein [Tahibacter soli]|uniref:MtrB/PioB family outer membrane beta-barrel protein n=1 Tax=Tahibacter soli TaxID=2983605 RepID=A0A9X4BIX3_9GAMM|nr:MtrB/PioB family outer membrane beta-barrel protein [Tahibacter soli]MDC8014471.1 MtrB/PioB family outer membrane beta-barrel protein [Tahibacter soli]